MRYGAVSYLNSRPLVEGLSPLVLDTPSGLVARFRSGEVDVALLPVAAAEPLGLRRVGRLGIVSAGPVDSVLLFLRRPLSAVKTVRLDPESRTSQVLALLLLREAHGLDPRIAEQADAELVIGDKALVRAQGNEARLDLALEWRRHTGLPFVFAAWYGAAGSEGALERAFARGQARIAHYAATSGLPLPAPLLERYLRERIGYRIGTAEEAGLARFLETGRRLGLL